MVKLSCARIRPDHSIASLCMCHQGQGSLGATWTRELRPEPSATCRGPRAGRPAMTWAEERLLPGRAKAGVPMPERDVTVVVRPTKRSHKIMLSANSVQWAAIQPSCPCVLLVLRSGAATAAGNYMPWSRIRRRGCSADGDDLCARRASSNDTAESQRRNLVDRDPMWCRLRLTKINQSV